ncbi:bifunctional protein PyrR [Verrucomicrobiota bacterium]|nr:bifunctional protein PyrR [Verrucomicrobiota bacterium]
MAEPIEILNPTAMDYAIRRIAHEIAERNACSTDLVLLGIPAGGIYFARRLSEVLAAICGHPIPAGSLDVTMHRDDLDQRATPEVHPTDIPVDLTGKVVVLVDDVIFRGRTARAALDALNDLGRPRRIQLAALIDRGHRELPITADFVGKNVPTAAHERIDVRWKESGGADQVVLLKP